MSLTYRQLAELIANIPSCHQDDNVTVVNTFIGEAWPVKTFDKIECGSAR